MNPSLYPHSQNFSSPDGDVLISFEQGKGQYQEYLRLKKQIHTTGDDLEELQYQQSFSRTMARESFAECVNTALPHSQQDIRIQSFFFLVELYQDDLEKTLMKKYFYQAVGLVQHTYPGDLTSSPHWGTLIRIYIEYINPEFTQIFPEKYLSAMTPLLRVNMIAEYTLHRHKQMDHARSLIQIDDYFDSHMSIIDWLESLFGPMRIVIVAQQGGEVIFSHRFPGSLGGTEPKHMHSTTVDIFDKKARYRVMVDRGGYERADLFETAYLEDIIYPVLDIYIRKKEYALCADTSDHSATIESYESQSESCHIWRDYSGLIRQIFSEYSPESSEQDIEICQKSITLCQAIGKNISNHRPPSDALLQMIDTLSGGIIQRRILMLVQAHLMTQHETMYGTGYPFGLSKIQIPIESRIYTIIRAYEALCAIYDYAPMRIHATLEDWGKGGYFDADILALFLRVSRDTMTYGTLTPTDTHAPISVHRRGVYTEYLKKWRSIIDQMGLIEQDYDDFRAEYTDNNTKNRIAKSMNEGILKLRRIADIRTILIVTRHGATLSDTAGGPPGDDDEDITECGEKSSRDKGDMLQGIKLSIHSSPILRSLQSARIICQRIHDCLGDSTSLCSQIQEDLVLKNPPKNRENGRYNSHAQKIFQDNTENLVESLVDTISSSAESTHLYITHRDTGRHIIFWLENLFVQDRTVGEKTPIENDTVLTYLFQGDTCIPWNLGFSLLNWKNTLKSVNAIAQSVFGMLVYEAGSGAVDIIRLHDRFLDFVDFHREYASQDFPEFQRRIGGNPLTRHLLEFLKT